MGRVYSLAASNIFERLKSFTSIHSFMENLLFVVHPGYWFWGMTLFEHIQNWINKYYGDYDDYLKKLEKEIWTRRNCIMFPYKNHDLPFDIPEETEVIRNYRNYEELIEKLRKRGITDLDICGEVLWSYEEMGNSEVKVGEIKEVGKNLLPYERDFLNHILDGKDDSELIDIMYMEEQRLDIDAFTHLSKIELKPKDGCVITAKNKLKNDFNVRIIRELCYPIKEPEVQTTPLTFPTSSL